MTVAMYIASAAWFCLVLGFLKRRERNLHIPLMLSGIGVDITLVLYLQFTRSAVQKAASFSMDFLPQCHVAVSTMALLLYFPVLFLGFRLLRDPGNLRLRSVHQQLAVPALLLRSLGFLLMFSMLEPS